MVASDSFAEFLREQLAPLGRITLRRMFGKTGVFCDGSGHLNAWRVSSIASDRSFRSSQKPVPFLNFFSIRPSTSTNSRASFLGTSSSRSGPPAFGTLP